MDLLWSALRWLVARPGRLIAGAAAVSILVPVLGFLLRDFVYKPIGTFLIWFTIWVVLFIPLWVFILPAAFWISTGSWRLLPDDVSKVNAAIGTVAVVTEMFVLGLPPVVVALASAGNTRAISVAAGVGGVPSVLSAVGFASQMCLVVVAGSLVLVPEVLRVPLPWNSASMLARSVVPACLAALAAAATWAYVFLLHFEKGPLASTPAAPLAVAALGAVLLLTPLYRSMSRSLWRKGILKVINAKDWQAGWRALREELRRALSPGNAGDGRAEEVTNGDPSTGLTETPMPES
jgi:hypothetical protein